MRTGRKVGGALAIVVALLAGAQGADANPWPWATLTVGETKTLASPEGRCTGPWQIDFGAPAVAIVHSEPDTVTIRGDAVSQGPLKLRCASLRATPWGYQPYEQALWVQVFPAAPDAVVPEVPFTVLTPAVFAALVVFWTVRQRRTAARLRGG